MKFITILMSLALVVLGEYQNSDIKFARIESCRGCSLNRLPEVKGFVLNDAPSYDNLEVKFITGAPPELVLLGSGDQELERLPLSDLSRDECNQLVQQKGFTKKSSKADL